VLSASPFDAQWGSRAAMHAQQLHYPSPCLGQTSGRDNTNYYKYGDW
jgi:hypothetical protein